MVKEVSTGRKWRTMIEGWWEWGPEAELYWDPLQPLAKRRQHGTQTRWDNATGTKSKLGWVIDGWPKLDQVPHAGSLRCASQSIKSLIRGQSRLSTLRKVGDQGARLKLLHQGTWRMAVGMYYHVLKTITESIITAVEQVSAGIVVVDNGLWEES